MVFYCSVPHLFPGRHSQDHRIQIPVSVLLQPLTLTARLIHLSSRTDESDHEVSGRGRSRGKTQTNLLLLEQKKILQSPSTHIHSVQVIL